MGKIMRIANMLKVNERNGLTPNQGKLISAAL